jgi:hypothetical protein
MAIEGKSFTPATTQRQHGSQREERQIKKWQLTR